MSDKKSEPIGRVYIAFVITVMFVAPGICTAIEFVTSGTDNAMAVIGKWFVFWAIGIRLLVAGIRQTLNPAFTAKDIFEIEDEKSYPIVRELGFSNLCSGLAAVISLYVPAWRITAAFIGGLYMGIAGINHAIRKPTGGNELVAMISDLFILVVMTVYIANSMLAK